MIVKQAYFLETFDLKPITKGLMTKNTIIKILTDAYIQQGDDKQQVKLYFEKYFENKRSIFGYKQTIDNQPYLFIKYFYDGYIEVHFINLNKVAKPYDDLNILNSALMVFVTMMNFIWQDIEQCKQFKITAPNKQRLTIYKQIIEKVLNKYKLNCYSIHETSIFDDFNQTSLPVLYLIGNRSKINGLGG